MWDASHHTTSSRRYAGVPCTTAHDAVAWPFDAGARAVSIDQALVAAMGDQRGVAAADRLCEACVTLLEVEGAAISLVNDGVNIATLGASDPAARNYDELQFTLGEGPCLDAVAHRAPVMIANLDDAGGEDRWPAYREAMLAHGIRGVYAMPIIVAGQYVGALVLLHAQPQAWTVDDAIGMSAAAHLAQLPVLDLLSGDLQAGGTDPDSDAWTELHTLTRAEISQATGIVMAQLGLTAAPALARLRALAYSTGRGATNVARDIIDHRLRMEAN